MVRLKNNKLRTDIYSKPTDTRQYLNHKLCHPSHVKRGIPYGQALRLRDSRLSREVKSGHLKGNKITLILNFHPGFSEVKSIIDSLWPILNASEDRKKVSGKRPMVTYRRPRNIKDELVRAKLKGENNESRGMKCGKRGC